MSYNNFINSVYNLFPGKKKFSKPVNQCLENSDLAKTTPKEHLENDPILEVEKGENRRLSRHFSSKEFDCHCKYPDCTTTLVDRRVVLALEEVRRDYKRPIKINSAYRCEKHNADVSGHKNSKHKLGVAVDIPTLGTIETETLLNDLLKERFPFVLIYPAKRNFSHVDFRSVPKKIIG